jgi:eukaryotic-like serine/threonine-protein kinase
MTPERYQKAGHLYHAVLEIEPEARAAFLEGACGGDAELRREVESLLAAHDKVGNYFAAPAVEVAARQLAQRQNPSLISQRFSHYQVLSLLGAGGMGEVYLAEDTLLGRKVALKFLPAHFTQDKGHLRRFEQEARATSSLNHPNIVMIFEVGQVEGRHFIATEYIGGLTLRERLSGARLELREALDVAAQIASALEAAHAAGIVHRDIKPENVMVRPDGLVKVLDFGLAKLIERRSQSSVSNAPTAVSMGTTPGLVLGTVSYMSPEQARGIEVDARSDIFSLGVVMYEMVAGQSPFAAESSAEKLAAILEREPLPLAGFAQNVPGELERIVGKALRKDREERYQTAKDLLLDLRGLKHRLEFEAELERSRPLNASDDAGDDASDAAATRNSEQARAAVAPDTPSNAARTVSGGEPAANRITPRRRTIIIALAASVILAAGLAYFFYFAGSASAIDSVAVLPLVNASNDPNTEYLSDGISESIISNLSQLPELRVMARATVFHFKGQEIDPQEVGRKLNVQAVLIGRLLQQGDRLVIRVELVKVSDGTQLWGAEFDRKLADALSIQQEIAREISEKLRLRLTGEDRKRLTGRDTTNAEAYQFYLRGRYYWNKRTANGLRMAMEQFRQAIDHDPNYSLGYVGLADCYLILEQYAGVPAIESLPKARAAVDRALQLDDSSAEAHTSSAFIYQQMWRWADAEREYHRAISLNPNYPTAHHWFTIYFATKRQFDDALREIKRAQELDPLSPIISGVAAYTYLLKDDLDSAIEKLKKNLELDPGFPGTHRGLGFAYLKQQRYEEATTEFQKAVELSGTGSEDLGELGYCYAITGKHVEARRILLELEENYARHELPGHHLAAVYAGLGEKDQAFLWLEKDFEQRSGRLPNITFKLTFDNLRSDPRYADLVRRMGLKP